MKHLLRKIFIFTLTFVSICSQTLPAFAQTLPLSREVNSATSSQEGVISRNLTDDNSTSSIGNIGSTIIEESTIDNNTEEKNINYISLMRDVSTITRGDKKDDAVFKDKVIKDYEKFLDSEKERLDNLNVSKLKQKQYFKFLEKVQNTFDTREQGFWTRTWNKFTDLIGLGDEEEKITNTNQTPEVLIPEKPGSFEFNKEIPQIKKIRNIEAKVFEGQKVDNVLLKLIGLEEAKADNSNLPTIDDVKEDSQEIIINSEIRELARSLNNNPVKIFNFVRNNISYEPYFGAKKGNLGCIKEKVCNDVDLASLTISLLRSAGIPSHYKKAVAILSTEQLKNLLGVDETKTAFGVLAMNKIPVFIIDGQGGMANPGDNLDQADFTGVTHLAVEWTFVEAFYDYDERGGNVDNYLDLQNATSTESIQSILGDYFKKQWISIDTIIKPYQHIKKEIVADTANFNTENFWYGFLQYNGTLSPVEKYVSDLKTTTGKDVTQTSYQSTNTNIQKDFNILPPALPYVYASGEGDDEVIDIETWINLPNQRKYQVKISLLKDSDKSVVLEQTFFGSEINNTELELFYEGSTNIDQQIIDSYGGIHATPAPLVNIKPYFLSDTGKYETNNSIEIGDFLILQFDYILKGNSLYTDQKFSTAGNQEGIFITLSQVQIDPSLDTNSNILLRGNVGLAREYLKRTFDNGKLLEKTLDYRLNYNFARAVVTQNRILNEIDGTPSTFDFKGLTIDATSFINDWSNRGNYKNHRKDFRLLWGLQASYYEGQLFNDIANLQGISTVKGLQYGYAHPSDYTIQKITKTNESIIDTLALSANTKVNMHTDVQNGNTIVTPNKYITDNNWKGILYISLDPEWTGTYAIGEQTQQNGGFSTDGLLVAGYYDDFNKYLEYYYKLSSEKYYLYQDMPDKVLSVNCSLSPELFNSIKAESGWKASYGFPCAKDTKTFGNVSHTYILTTYGAKFYSPNKYSYWVTLSSVLSKMDQYMKKLPKVDEKYVFKFSAPLGTYIHSICTQKGLKNCDNWSYSTIYYSPNNSEGNIFRLKGGFWDKAGANDNKIIKILGFPLNDETNAAKSLEGEEGVYQDFINGQMYYYEEWALGWVYYTYGKITEKHKELGGTYGELGFPEDDPKVGLNGLVYQTFENNKQIEWNTVNSIINIVEYKKYRCELYSDVKNTFILDFIAVHGFADGSVALVGDLGSLAWSIGNGVYFYDETFNAISTALDQFDLQKSIAFIGNAGSAGYQYLKEEYNSSFGSQGCPARQAYIRGRITPDILAIAIPASKLSQIFKLKLVNKIGDIKLVVSNEVRNIVEESVETLVGVAKKGIFKGKPIFGVSKDFSQQIPWYSNPVAPGSPFQIKKAIDAEYLKGDLEYNFYSLQKAMNDPYLVELSSKGDEILFVLKEDGKVVIAPRGSYAPFPHPVLSNGAPVRSAGTIKLNGNGIFEISNKSGHFKPTPESLYDMKIEILKVNPNAVVDVTELYK